MYIIPIFWEGDIQAMSETRHMKAKSTYIDAPKRQKMNFKHFLELLIIYVKSNVAWKISVNHAENWHQLEQSGPGM